MNILLKDTDGLVFAISVSYEEFNKCKNRHDMETLALKYAHELEEKFIAYKQKAMIASIYGKVTKNET